MLNRRLPFDKLQKQSAAPYAEGPILKNYPHYPLISRRDTVSHNPNPVFFSPTDTLRCGRLKSRAGHPSLSFARLVHRLQCQRPPRTFPSPGTHLSLALCPSMKFLLVLLCLSPAFAQDGSGEGPIITEVDEIEGSAEGSGETGFDDDCYPKMDVIFLLDTSGSIKTIYQEHVRWTVDLVESLYVHKNGVRVAAVQYAGSPLTEFTLGTYPTPSNVRDHLEGMEFRSGVTRTGDALLKAQRELFSPDRGGRADAKKVIVLFTDGLSIDNPNEIANELRLVRGVTIYVVGLADDAYKPEIEAIAGDQSRVYRSHELARLRAQLTLDAEEAVRCKTVTEDIKNKPELPDNLPVLQPIDETNTVDNVEEIISGNNVENIVISAHSPFPVETTILPELPNILELEETTTHAPATTTRRTTVRTRPTTRRTRPTTRRTRPTTRKFDDLIAEGHQRIDEGTLDLGQSGFGRGGGCSIDLLIVLDSSGSVQNMYNQQKTFVEELMEQVREDGSQRMAVVQFAGDRLQKTEFSFDTHKTKSQLRKALTQVRHFTGTTYIGAALSHARRVLNDRRTNARTIVVLVSDGYSQDEALPVAETIRDMQNVKMYAVGLADLNNEKYLNELAGDSKNVYIGRNAANTLTRLMESEMNCRRS